MESASKLQATNIVGRNLRILEALAGAFRVNLDELAHRAGLAKSTTHRILANLVVAGLVAKDGRAGEYRLTGAFSRIGRRIDDRSLVLDAVAEEACEMTLRRSWPLAVSVLDHGMMLVIFGTRKLTTRTLKPSMLYERLDLTTAMGQAALSSMTARQRADQLDALPPYARGSHGRSEIEELVKIATARGYGLRMTGRAGTSSVAVGLNFGGPTIGALASTVFTKVASYELMRSLADDLHRVRVRAEVNYRAWHPDAPLGGAVA
jgi:DNA-binding IclR family transcriptional regulator